MASGHYVACPVIAGNEPPWRTPMPKRSINEILDSDEVLIEFVEERQVLAALKEARTVLQDVTSVRRQEYSKGTTDARALLKKWANMADPIKFGQTPTYLCEKHGEQNFAGISFALEGGYTERFTERFCAECILELLREHCCILTEIKADG